MIKASLHVQRHLLTRTHNICIGTEHVWESRVVTVSSSVQVIYVTCWVTFSEDTEKQYKNTRGFPKVSVKGHWYNSHLTSPCPHGNRVQLCFTTIWYSKSMRSFFLSNEDDGLKWRQCDGCFCDINVGNWITYQPLCYKSSMLSMTNDFFFASFDKKSSFSPAKCVNSVMFTIFTFKVLCFFHLFCKQYTYTSNFSSNTMFMSTSFGTKQ